MNEIKGDSETKGDESRLSTAEDFNHALDTTRQLVDEKVLWWRAGGEGGITPRLDEPQFTDAVGKHDSQNRRLYERILEQEITVALNSITGSRTFPPLMYHLRGWPEADQEEFVNKRIPMVADVLFSRSLRERTQIRQTAKGALLDELRWDISVKKHDLNRGAIPDVPYATVEMVVVDTAGTSFPSQFLREKDRQFVTFDCHLDDIELIIKDLTELRDNLQRLSTKPDEEGAQ